MPRDEIDLGEQDDTEGNATRGKGVADGSDEDDTEGNAARGKV